MCALVTGVQTCALPILTSLHKEQWWNVLIANPLGYLAADSPLELVEIDLPRREVLPFGPWWLRTWEFVFFTTLVAASLAIKLLFRLVLDVGTGPLSHRGRKGPPPRLLPHPLGPSL